VHTLRSNTTAPAAAGRDEAAAAGSAWHTLPPEAVLERLGSRPEGLRDQEAEERLARFGPNEVAVVPPASVWSILLAQFRSVVVGLLAAATVVAWVAGERLDAIAIFVVLVLNAALGFVMELKARRAMEALRQLDVPRARVVRSGHVVEIDARNVVPGDVIDLEAGRSLPADARLLAATELRCVESALTGESLPVEKRADVALPPDTPLAERSNLVYRATLVAAGTGRAVVFATGNQTEVGRIGRLTGEVGPERTPLEKRLDSLGRRLVWLALAVAAVVAGLGLLQGQPVPLVLETALALAVAAVPEGLPAVATIALAVGVHRMSRRRVLVRRLPQVETLGSTTVVCTDKTGTLTAGVMTVTSIVVHETEFAVSGTGYAPQGSFSADGAAASPSDDPILMEALRIGALCNRAELLDKEGRWEATGDPTEAALLAAARKAGLDRDQLRREWVETAEIPFSSERGWMATFHEARGQTVALVKGAPGRIIDRSASIATVGGTVRLEEAGRAALRDRNRELAARGLRVLALARGEGARAGEEPRDLTFVGLVGIEDPIAEGVPETIATFASAGIRTVMITGDQRLTAQAVAERLGILRPGSEVLEGRELARVDEARLSERLARVGAFSRVSPEDKLRIVAGFQAGGEVVAMLGDGVNDAPALKKADVGVAMGRRGTDVAKEAAAVVLQDDRFPTLAVAVEEGRVIFDNIRKFVFYLFSCNLAEILVLLVSGVAGLPPPLFPLQILWLNLVTDTLPALSLAVEPAEPHVMARAPRDPRAAILSRPFLAGISFYAALISAATLAAFLVALRAGSREHAATAAFMTLGLAQGFHLGNARTGASVLRREQVLRNPWALAALAAVVVVQVIAVWIDPLARLLGLASLSPALWGMVAGLSLVPAVVGQAIRWIRERGREKEERQSTAGGRSRVVS
jgi:Ca2+-transporting ATPase